MIRPTFQFFNALYRQPPFSDQSFMQSFVAGLGRIGNVLKVNDADTNAYMADDMIAWFRTLGFTTDPEFIAAFEPYANSGIMRAKLWRVYTYCWAVRQAPAGACIDLGCYDAKVVHIAQRYAPERSWTVYDAFDEHPHGEHKELHGAALVERVHQRLQPGTGIVSGLLPDSLHTDWRHQWISFISVDLNDHEAEIACLEKLWPNVAPGGIILLDDYGWSAYRSSYDAHKAFFDARGHGVLEMPTGQGLVVRR